MRGTRLVTGMVAVATIAAAGCSGAGGAPSTPTPTQSASPSAAPSPPPLSRSPRSPVPPQSSADPFSPGPQSPGSASVDDLKTYAYATTDRAGLATETAALTEIVADLAVDATQRAVESVQADAERLLAQAGTLGHEAGAAADRLRPLFPSSAAMAVAHRDGVAAFGTTELYATTATNLATAAQSQDAQAFADVAEQAVALAARADDLATADASLEEELTAWADANPSDAATALAEYGGEG